MRLKAFAAQHRVFCAALLLLILATGILSMVRAGHGSNDFDTFYHAGRAVLKGEGIYYTGEYYQASETVSPFLYPPFAACFFALWAWLPLSLAAFLWNLFLVACAGLTLFLILKYLDLNADSARDSWRKISKLDKAALIVMSAGLLLDNLSMAQINIFTFALCMLSLVLWKQGKPWLAGFVLTAGIWIKLTPLIFCVFFAARKSWKTLAAVAVGSALILGLTTLIFGADQNRIFHRQWAGRTLKPSLAGYLQKVMPPEGYHPLKRTWKQWSLLHLSEVFADKNQSLESMLTRLFLKNRNDYAFSPEFPIYSAQRYAGLPVIAGGLKLENLTLLHQIIRLALMLTVILSCLPRPSTRAMLFLQTSSIFLAMTLFAPLNRTYQFVSFVFFYAFLFLPEFQNSKFKIPFRVSVLFYAGMASLYGRAACTGMWANLVLWFAVTAGIFLRLRRERTPVTAETV